MSLPKKVLIAGCAIRIVYRDLGDEDCYGLYSYKRRTITVHNELEQDDLYETLRHEMMHAALALSGITFCERYEEEAIIRCMDEIFFPAWDRLLRNFPTLINETWLNKILSKLKGTEKQLELNGINP